MFDARLAARAYTREHGEDDPAIADWTWPNRDDGHEYRPVGAGR